MVPNLPRHLRLGSGDQVGVEKEEKEERGWERRRQRYKVGVTTGEKKRKDLGSGRQIL